MDANTRKIEAIFDPNVFFQVPLFQRPYVWNEKDNWEPLWEDIHALLQRQLRNGKVHAHFLGAVVLEQLPHPAGSIETRQVIDGQQRFTTLQLFLMAARNLAAAHGSERFADRFTGLVENDPSRVEAKEEKFKLWPTNSDRLAFKTVHGCDSLDSVDKAVQGKPLLVGNNLVGAYRYFHTKLADWIDGKDDDPEDQKALEGKTRTDRLEALWQVVKDGLQLVVINLGEGDETQVIFETLNARGTDLLPADLIKNFLFRRAQLEGADVEELYADHWARFESDFWREKVSQGRIERPRIDLFVNHYLTLMTRDEVKTTHLFQAFKRYVEERSAGSPQDAAGHIRQLARFADIYHAFHNPGDHVALERFFRMLEAVDTATVYPVVLHAYDQLNATDPAEFDRVLAVLESFLVRRLVANATSKNYNRLFVDLIRATDRAGEMNADVVAEQLTKASGDSTRFPTDAELRLALDQPVYNRMAQYKVRGILEALEEASQSAKSPVLPVGQRLTIEHVMPQGWPTHWPLPAESVTDPVKKLEAIGRRETMLNTLGNLTLITGSFNSSLQNAAWAVKRPELLKFAKLNLTQYFHGPDANEWDEEAIAKRTEHLFSLMVNRWPYPTNALVGA
jgi:uncharacterized protein with ParB-like and HNH nuclease domain